MFSCLEGIWFGEALLVYFNIQLNPNLTPTLLTREIFHMFLKAANDQFVHQKGRSLKTNKDLNLDHVLLLCLKDETLVLCKCQVRKEGIQFIKT